jgi:hypothetical protein
MKKITLIVLMLLSILQVNAQNNLYIFSPSNSIPTYRSGTLYWLTDLSRLGYTDGTKLNIGLVSNDTGSSWLKNWAASQYTGNLQTIMTNGNNTNLKYIGTNMTLSGYDSISTGFITHNFPDNSIALTIQQANSSSTGYYVEGLNSSNSAIWLINTSGTFSGAGVSNIASSNNSFINTNTIGAIISRKVNDLSNYTLSLQNTGLYTLRGGSTTNYYWGLDTLGNLNTKGTILLTNAPRDYQSTDSLLVSSIINDSTKKVGKYQIIDTTIISTKSNVSSALANASVPQQVDTSFYATSGQTTFSSSSFINGYNSSLFVGGTYLDTSYYSFNSNTGTITMKTGIPSGINITFITTVKGSPISPSLYVSKSNILGIVYNKNLADTTLFQLGYYYSPSSHSLQVSSSGNTEATLGYQLVQQDSTYTVSGTADVLIGGYFNGNTYVSPITFNATTGATNAYSFTVPLGTGITSAVFNAFKTELSPSSTLQIEKNTVATSFQKFFYPYLSTKIETDSFNVSMTPLATFTPTQNLVDTLADSTTYIIPTGNMFQVGTGIRGVYFSPGSDTLVVSPSYRCTPLIPCQPNTQYVVLYNHTTGGSGGLFRKNGTVIEPLALNSIPNGYTFFTGAEGGYFVINITDVGRDSTHYDSTMVIIPNDSLSSTGYRSYVGQFRVLNSNSISKNLQVKNYEINPTYPGKYKNMLNYFNLYLQKDTDVVVVDFGTSLWARTYTTTYRIDSAYCAPLMTCQNLMTLLWNKNMWPDQQYRRFDVPNFYTETGTNWIQSDNNAVWDDGSYREGWTRFTTSVTASVTYSVPTSAWQANFIYRTDSLGTTSALVTIGGGNGLMQAWNGTSWVEANGYTFSMKEGPKTITKGNTTFQKRLKMRCTDGSTFDSRSVAKIVTISKSNNTTDTGRLLYWGTEWTPRKSMYTWINAARGSHNFSSATIGLPEYWDNEVFGFNPNLIVAELPIINESACDTNEFHSKTVAQMDTVIDTFVFNSNNIHSLWSRTNGFTTCNFIFCLDHMTAGSTAWDLYGNLNVGTETATGKRRTCYDYYDGVNQFMINKSQTLNVPFIYMDYNDYLKNLCNIKFGSYYIGLMGSGKTGPTQTQDATHDNNRGAQDWYNFFNPVFDFTTN